MDASDQTALKASTASPSLHMISQASTHEQEMGRPDGESCSARCGERIASQGRQLQTEGGAFFALHTTPLKFARFDQHTHSRVGQAKFVGQHRRNRDLDGAFRITQAAGAAMRQQRPNAHERGRRNERRLLAGARLARSRDPRHTARLQTVKCLECMDGQPQAVFARACTSRLVRTRRVGETQPHLPPAPLHRPPVPRPCSQCGSSKHSGG